MDNRDIFDFDFVDRTKEQIILNRFLNNDYKNNFLWIDGFSGIGKTFLIQNAILYSKNNHHIYVNLSAEKDTEKCLVTILKEIQKHSEYENIFDFIKNNYTSLLDISKGIVTELIKEKHPTIEYFFTLLFDSSKMFLDNTDRQITPKKLLEIYFDNLLKNRKILLIIDNFSYCDENSLSVLQQILHKHIHSDRLKCIFVTTQEILEKKEYLQVFLTEKFPIKYLKMAPLGDAKYFYSILDSIFEIDSEMAGQINLLFDLCSGKPEDLKAFIRKLYLSNAISIPDTQVGRAKININLMKKQIISKSIELDRNDFSDNERFILLILIGFRGEVEIKLLQEAIMYIHEKLFHELTWTTAYINTIISKLELMNIIELTKSNSPIIKIAHDKVYYSLLTIINTDINSPLISHYFLKFLRNLISLGNNTYQIDFDYLIAFHSCNSQDNGWEQINYDYGEALYDKYHYFDAYKIFSRLSCQLLYFSNSQKLLIAKCYYEVGEYLTAKSILDCIEENTEDMKFSYEYHYFMGKTENVLLNKNKAIYHFDIAFQNAYDRNSQILMLHLKHLSLLETPEGKEEAKKIFDDIALHLTQQEEHMMSVCYLLRNCNQFYTGNSALYFFNKAIEIAKENNSNVDIAYVYNNMGLELFRTGNYDKAYDKFFSSFEILSEDKIHESSYPLNNMAVYEMFNGDYSKALSYLLDAKYINQSIYAGLAIKVHMMICYRKLKKEKNCRNIMVQLSNYLKEQTITDYNIIRKLAINLCITHKEYGEISEAKECLNYAYPYVKNTISEYRCVKLHNEFFNGNDSYENALQSNRYYTRLDFEPWIITLSHD